MGEERRLIDRIPVPALQLNADGRLSAANPAFRRFQLEALEPAVGPLDVWLSSLAFPSEHTESAAKGVTHSFRLEDPAVWIDSYSLEEGGRLLLFVDEEEKREALLGEGCRDTVTGLPGREILLRELAHRRHGDPSTPRAFFFIAFDDLYRFDHFVTERKAEQVLRKLAGRLCELKEEGDLLAYLGNDKFLLVRPGIEQASEAEELARKLLHRNAEALSVEGEIFYLNLAIGIALSPFDAREAPELLRLAEKAMRQARRDGWNRYVFSHRVEPGTRFGMLEELSRALPEAIERDELYFVYQPQYCLATRRFVGAEMLVRWEHETLGALSPALFLPLAEQNGMIRFITMRALTQAAKSFERLEAMGLKDFSLSVNLSPTAIFHRDFLENLEFFLTHYGLEGRPLHLEITENILAHNMAVMRETLMELRERGLGIEIDDYGTGYTSLNALTELPVDRVKIDRQYVQGIDKDPKVRTIYRAMILTAEALGMDVVAEGVENEAELKAIEAIGKVRLQGWHLSRPLEEEAFFDFLKQECRT